MGPRDSADVVRIILYLTLAVILMVTAYAMYIRKYRRGKLEAMNNVILTTSRYDRYSGKTQFMLELPKASKVRLSLLDQSETKVTDIVDGEFEAGQHTIAFDPGQFKNGIYYLSLLTDHASVLRKITIEMQT